MQTKIHCMTSNKQFSLYNNCLQGKNLFIYSFYLLLNIFIHADQITSSANQQFKFSIRFVIIKDTTRTLTCTLLIEISTFPQNV